MANFTPIANGAAANAAIVNAPLYELDTAITSLQSVGSVVATRPWAVIGGTAQPTSSDNVPVTADITHTGKLVRGATSITSTLADMETRGNLAVGGGNHVFTGVNALAVGEQNTVNARALAVGIQNSTGLNSLTCGALNIGAAPYSILNGYSSSIDAGSVASSILSGIDNGITSASLYSIICSGQENTIVQVNYGFIGGGNNHLLGGNAHNSAIVGGVQNNLQGGAVGGLIGAGYGNYLISTYGAIVAGASNQTGNKPYAFVGAGLTNNVTGTGSAIVAGNTNWIGTISIGDSSYSIIGAGGNNRIQDSVTAGIVAGQANQLISSTMSFIGAGNVNVVTNSFYSAIAAGYTNKITSPSYAFIGAGSDNTISGAGAYGAIIAGQANTLTGARSTIMNGQSNTVSGTYALAGGVYSNVTHENAFMWNSVATTFASAAAGEFAVTAFGGVRLFTNVERTTGMTLPAGASSWSAVSSARLKGDFHQVEQQAILDRLLAVPIQTYRFKDGEDFHANINLGPTAEDWDAAFADILGAKTIALNDEAIPAISEGDKLGVALAAIQGLTKLVYELQAKLN